MILPQIAEKLTATDIQESSAQNYGASEEWVRGSGFSKAASKLNNTKEIIYAPTSSPRALRSNQG